MKTYVYAEKNGNATIVISEETKTDALVYLSGIVKDINAFRLDSVESE